MDTSSKSENVEEIIRDLLSPSQVMRERALSSIKNQWTLDFRPYIWTAIENENNREFQFQLVKFVIDKLKEKSLRKMIRFIEKNQLFPKARNYVIKAYTEYEDKQIREALIKSSKRPQSGSINFILDLIKSNMLEHLSSSQAFNFIQSIAGDDYNQQFFNNLSLILLKKRTHEFRQYVGIEFLKKFQNHQKIKTGILHALCNTKWKKTKDLTLYWRKKQVSKPLEFHFSEVDTFVINSLSDKNGINRHLTIKLLSTQGLGEGIFQKDEISKTQLDVAFDIIFKLEKSQLIDKFLELNQYDPNHLETFFEKNMLNNNDLYSELRIFEVHPEHLLKLIYLTYPRMLLLKLSYDDPIEENRAFAMEKLNNNKFWFGRLASNEMLLGSIQFIVDKIRKNSRALIFETNDQIKFNAVNLFDTLLKCCNSVEYETQIKIKESIISSEIKENLNTLRKDPIAGGIAISYLLFIYDRKIIFEPDDQLTNKHGEIIIKDLIDKIPTIHAIESLIILVENAIPAIKNLFISLLEVKIRSTKNPNKSTIEGWNLLLNLNRKDNNIKLRTSIKFLLNKIQDLK